MQKTAFLIKKRVKMRANSGFYSKLNQIPSVCPGFYLLYGQMDYAPQKLFHSGIV